MSKIITIGREFGSGGRELGKRLAEILQIPYYDNEIVTQLAERTQLATEYVEQFSEKVEKTIHYFPITTGRSFYTHVNQIMIKTSEVHIEQGKLLKELAEKNDCVIVGRCADYVLKDFNPLRVFVYASMESKVKRCKEKAPEHEKMSDKELKQLIRDIDKNRAQYYEYVTGKRWDDKTNHDMLLNTTNFQIKDLARIVSQLFK